MVTLKTPEAPATKKQLWLLHILTKTDTRGLKLTMQQASDRIEELKSNNNGKHPQGDTARADYRISGIRPLVNPHASAIKQDKQKLAQIRYDKANPKPEIEFTQGIEPSGQSNMAAIEDNFKANAYQQGYDFADNPDVKVDFYDFQCHDCFFGKSGICIPNWIRAGYTTCQQVVESVSFNCVNHEPLKYQISDYCYRPKGKQCHRKKIDNHCLECAYRKSSFRLDYSNRTAWARYIPTIQDRIKHHSLWLDKFKDKPEALAQVNNIISLLTKLI